MSCRKETSEPAGKSRETSEGLRVMRKAESIITAETFRFFRELGRNNRKKWMDENRERYRQHVVALLRRLLDALTPSILKLHSGFLVGGRSGENFSRINRDIRFANDKTPYYTQMYLFFPRADALGRYGGQLYVGLSAETVTIGFRIYSWGGENTLRRVGISRALKNDAWLERRRKKLARKYECYWYSAEKGKWTKHPGWPREAKEWKKCKGWIVRKKFAPAAATRPGFVKDVEKIFCELFPLLAFSSLPEWKP
ncbi:MAG TPA: DUF2461 family protein [Candidatus Acidoferrales bacterium]|nr:DUF2461 family protein [Candidatus Acidoferrales bacterium]